MSTQNKPIDIVPHLFERSAPQLAKLVGLADLDPPQIAAAAEGTHPVPATLDRLEIGRAAQRVDRTALRRAGVVDLEQGRSRVFEEFRIVQDQVVRLLSAESRDRPAAARLVLVTSAAPGEGKSFVSANLAASLATCGRRDVLLVDVDPKWNSLSHSLGLSEAPGLLDAALSPGPALTIKVFDTATDRLSVLPVGGHSSERSVMSATGVAPNLLRRLCRALPGHIVVLDAPPCLASSDASMLATLADQVVMVVAATQTQQGDLEAALDLVQACPHIALLLNKIRSPSGSGFGRYGDYK